MSIGDRLPIRPGYGTKGVKVELTANYVELLPPSDIQLYRYSIQIKPEPARRQHFRLVELLLQSEELAPQRDELATDFRSTLISKMKLSSNDFIVKIQYRAEGEDEPPAGAAHYAVQVAYTTTLHMSDLMNYLASTNLDERFEEKSVWEQTFNIFLNHYAKATKTLVAIGTSKSFSLSQLTGRADLGSGLQVLRGFFSSVRIATGRVLVNVNVSHAAFYHAGPLPMLMNSYGVRSTTALERFLKLVRIQTSHLPEKRNKAGEMIPRLKTIFGLARKDDGHGMAHPPRILHHGAGAKDVQFWLEGDASAGSNSAAKAATEKKGKAKGKGKPQPAASASGKYISVFDFFKTSMLAVVTCLTFSDYVAAYDRTLQHPELPLMNCGSRHHPMYLPAEVCVVVQGQPSRSKLDSNQTQQMIRHAVRKPWINAASIATEGISTVGLDENSNVLLVRLVF